MEILRDTWGVLSGFGPAGLTAFGLSFVLTPVVRSMAVRLGWVARPMEDRWGRRVVARLGGAAMFVGIAAATLAWVPLDRPVIGLLAGTALVFLLGLADDLRRLTPYAKLMAQLLVGCLVVSSGVRIDLPQWPWVAIPLSILWFVLIMNAFNLLDNMDGLAAGVGAIAAGFCAFHAALAQQWTVALLAVILVGACAGFLRFNFPPAKIFMGDSGSHVLGLNLAGLALLGSWHHSTQLLSVLAVPALVLAVPIFDTCFVTIQRLLHGQHPFTGGRDHVSHRLAVLGLSTRQAVFALYTVSTLLGLLSVIAVTLQPLQALLIWVVVLAMLVLVGRYLAQVNVYRLEPQAVPSKPVELGEPVTLIETMLMHKRRLIEILVDFSLVSSVYAAAHLLRYEGTLTFDIQQLIVKSLPIVLTIKLMCFAAYGLYRRVWRYVGLSDVIVMVKAITLGSVLSSLALLYLWRFQGYSRAVLVIDWMLTCLAVGGSRIVERLLDEWISSASSRGTPVLIIGAGETGVRVLRSLTYGVAAAQRPVGFLDDDVRKHGTRIHGVPVLGGRGRLAAVLDREQVQEVLVAIADPPAQLLHHVQRCCEPRGTAWKVVTAGVTETV
ncbi:MAG: hypothetical protein HYY91_00495 [Candidatus Omnitrophica bacterium]|nr:hypothetical protein [Candidatus Omnitrophota bacterium]